MKINLCEYNWNGCSVVIRNQGEWFSYIVSREGQACFGSFERTFTGAQKAAENVASKIGTGVHWDT